jgi:hypothetical protein
MVTKRTYECNVCRSPIKEDNGRGFQFGSGRVDWVSLYMAENHICDHCIKCLMTAFRDSGIVNQFGAAVGDAPGSASKVSPSNQPVTKADQP